MISSIPLSLSLSQSPIESLDLKIYTHHVVVFRAIKMSEMANTNATNWVVIYLLELCILSYISVYI